MNPRAFSHHAFIVSREFIVPFIGFRSTTGEFKEALVKLQSKRLSLSRNAVNKIKTHSSEFQTRHRQIVSCKLKSEKNKSEKN